MVVPHDHNSQNLLVALLQQLQRLPRHRVPHKVGDEVVHKELWVLTPENKYDGLEQWLWEIDQGRLNMLRASKKRPLCTSTSLPSWHASSPAGWSRQLVKALSSDPRPFATRNPGPAYQRITSRGLQRPAQWVIYAGDALYELCKKEVTTEIGKQKWTLSLWEEWKSKFEVAKSEKFSAKTRAFASAAFEKMGEAERNGVTTNVAVSFGFTSMKG
ncbi:hypothetical protein J3459_006619 [Metarhizium acridum]|nr:hypothetical protein J3459_006619 [Metarhizium acridum]